VRRAGKKFVARLEHGGPNAVPIDFGNRAALLLPAFARSVGASWPVITFTALGEQFSPNLLTTARRSIPFDTPVNSENLKNKERLVVWTSDLGSHHGAWVIDMTKGATATLGLVKAINASIGLRSPAGMDREQ
jgi:hypothetical protein